MMVEQLIQQTYGDLDTPMMRKLRAEGEAVGRAEGEAVGRAEGEAVGRAEGEAVGQEQLVLRQLARRCGALDAQTLSQVQQLSQEQRLELADALLDFQHLADLNQWLASQVS